MQKSKLFNYVKNQVILENFNSQDLVILATRNVISDTELEELLSMISQL